MGLLSKLGKFDPIGSKLHKADPLGKYDILGSAIYGGAGAQPAAGGAGGPSYSVSAWSPEMQSLHDYYANTAEKGGLGLAGQQAVGWNPGMMSPGQIMDQYTGYGGAPMQGRSSIMGWQEQQLDGAPQQYPSGGMAPMYGGGYDFSGGGIYGQGQGMSGYRSSMYPQIWGRPAY